MKLWEHPRLTGALCAVAVLACAAMPAAFLAVTDAAYIGRVVPVADPYTAPRRPRRTIIISCASWPPAVRTAPSCPGLRSRPRPAPPKCT